jgi:subfamily B ATP-binding cassette protein MsbA
MTVTDHGSTWSLYRRLLGYARPYTLRLTIGILAGLVNGGALFGLFQMTGDMIKPFEDPPTVEEREPAISVEPDVDLNVQFVERTADQLGISLTEGDGRMSRHLLIAALIVLPLLIALRAGAVYVNCYIMRWVGARVVRDLRDRVFEHLQCQSLKFFGKSDIGGLISRCTNDTTLIESVVSASTNTITRAPIEIIASILFVIHAAKNQGMVGFVALLLVIFPICIVPVIVLGHYVRKHMRRALSRIAELASRMHENFTCVRVVKAFDMENREVSRFKQMNANYFRSIIRALRAELLMTPLMEAVGALLAIAFLVVCYAQGVRFSQIVPIGLAAVVVYRPVKQLARLNANLQRGASALERIFGLLDLDTEVRESANPVRIETFRDRVAFEGISFSYEEGTSRVLADIDFEIPKGSVVACVGETGSGKTTLANLLARFYDPIRGKIMLDGVDLREIETASLRKLISIVTQDTILFNDTIAYNIAYGSGDVSREAIESAAREANAHEFIVGDPAGYERVVGEKGFVLSGGEKQRLALARAILHNSPILILDEATSALDTVTERLVQEAIARVMIDRTVFAIAHRLSTVRHADLILLLDGGRIVERGTHEELYAAGGNYQQLCAMQVLDN